MVGLLAQAIVLPCTAQKLMRSNLVDGQVHLIGADRAVLNSGEARTDIPCRVTPLKPNLGFDLQFLAGYQVSIPLQSLAGDGDKLRILFRIRPLNGEDRSYHFLDYHEVPTIPPDAGGNATLGGSYIVGPGTYQVDWLMRNNRGEVCADHWQIATHNTADVVGLVHESTAYRVSSLTSDIFAEDPPIRRLASKNLLHVRVLVNFTPTDPRNVRLRSYDLQNLIAILRAISREPTFGTFDLTAFNMQQERIIFEQDAFPRIDFPTLGRAVKTIEGGTVDLARLSDENSGARFLGSLLKRSFNLQNSVPGAVVILGPKLVLEQHVSLGQPDKGQGSSVPAFHFIYDSTPSAYPWRDAISNALKSHNVLEYGITFPKDLITAMRDMLKHLHGRSFEAHVSGRNVQAAVE